MPSHAGACLAIAVNRCEVEPHTFPAVARMRAGGVHDNAQHWRWAKFEAASAAVTTNPAEAFRLSDRGRIEVGRKGDLVLVRGNPTVNITAARDVLRVWRSGVEQTRTVPKQ